MFKKVFSTAMAAAMVMSMGSIARAAVSKNIYGIDSNSYAYSKELGAVNLDVQNPAFTYGDTVYYPFLNSGASEAGAAVENAQNLLTEANETLRRAQENLNSANAELKSKEEALNSANEKLILAENVKKAADEWKTSSDNLLEDENEKNLAYNEALKAYNSELPAEIDAESAAAASEIIVENERTAAAQAENLKNDAKADVEKEAVNVKSAEEAVKAKQEELTVALRNSNKFVDSSDAVKGIKIKSSWELNGNAVEDVSVTKKKAAASFDLDSKYIYFVAVDLKDQGKTDETDIIGTVSMRKSGEFDYEDMQLEVNLTVGYASAEDNVIGKTPLVFSVGSGLSGESDDELRFEFDEDAFFTVDTNGQKDILIAADNEFDANIAMIYNAANLDFFNGNGAVFNKLGTLAIPAEEGSFIYKIDKNGKLSKANAVYDKDEEAFMIRTRALERYVISDIDLKLDSAVKPSKPSGNITNPQTGSII